jgi:hypothetical protein
MIAKDVLSLDTRYAKTFHANLPDLIRDAVVRSLRVPTATMARSLSTPFMPGPSTHTPYPAPVARWQDLYKIEQQLVERELARWGEKSSDSPWARRVMGSPRQIDDDEEAAKARQLVRRITERSDHQVLEGPQSDQRRRSTADVVFGGEHPTIAYARHLAEIDYQRQRAHEPDLVDPMNVPIDTTWQEQTYSGQAVGAAWLRLEEERREHGPTRTSAVPIPLNFQKHVAETPMDEARTWSYCHVAKKRLPGRHIRVLERGCSCQFDAAQAQSTAQSRQDLGYLRIAERSDSRVVPVKKSTAPRVHFSVPSPLRYDHGRHGGESEYT